MRPPTINNVTQGKHGRYNAVDYSARPDPTIYAPEGGVITAYGASGTCGNRLELTAGRNRHGFCHLERPLVKVNQKVRKGQKIGIMGYTGYTIPSGSAGRHLHWVINRGNTYIYPPSLITEPFGGLKEEDVKKPTRAEIKRAWNTLLKEEPSERNYKGYGAKDISWMWHDIAQNLRKRLDKAQDSDSKVKSIKNKIVDFVNKVKP